MELTVSKVNEYIRNMFEYEPGLNDISVKGEVSNCKYHSSGHIYFTLKDEKSQLTCVMFYNSRSGLKFKMESGQSVVVTGKISVYERDGKYQLYARKIDKAGMGNLYEKYEKLKAQLMMEGLFETAHKKPIPQYVSSVGIVTSSGAAALADILKVSRRRNPYISLFLCPVAVQGDKAAQTIADGIRKMDNFGVDVIIVGRGGGSIEELWAFNEEVVARACYECQTPVISAVGHETDTTIIDLVADLRAPTPSAAAELAIYDYIQMLERRDDYVRQMSGAVRLKLQFARNRQENLALRLKMASPSHRIMQEKQHIDELSDKLKNNMNRSLSDAKHKLALLAGRLDGVSPVKKLEQGYSFIADESGRNINKTSDVKKGDNINIRVIDGVITAKVTDVEMEK